MASAAKDQIFAGIFKSSTPSTREALLGSVDISFEAAVSIFRSLPVDVVKKYEQEMKSVSKETAESIAQAVIDLEVGDYLLSLNIPVLNEAIISHGKYIPFYIHQEIVGSNPSLGENPDFVARNSVLEQVSKFGRKISEIDSSLMVRKFPSASNPDELLDAVDTSLALSPLIDILEALHGNPVEAQSILKEILSVSPDLRTNDFFTEGVVRKVSIDLYDRMVEESIHSILHEKYSALVRMSPAQCEYLLRSEVDDVIRIEGGHAFREIVEGLVKNRNASSLPKSINKAALVEFLTSNVQIIKDLPSISQSTGEAFVKYVERLNEKKPKFVRTDFSKDRELTVEELYGLIHVADGDPSTALFALSAQNRSFNFKADELVDFLSTTGRLEEIISGKHGIRFLMLPNVLDELFLLFSEEELKEFSDKAMKFMPSGMKWFPTMSDDNTVDNSDMMAFSDVKFDLPYAVRPADMIYQNLEDEEFLGAWLSNLSLDLNNLEVVKPIELDDLKEEHTDSHKTNPSPMCFSCETDDLVNSISPGITGVEFNEISDKISEKATEIYHMMIDDINAKHPQGSADPGILNILGAYIAKTVSGANKAAGIIEIIQYIDSSVSPIVIQDKIQVVNSVSA